MSSGHTLEVHFIVFPQPLYKSRLIKSAKCRQFHVEHTLMIGLLRKPKFDHGIASLAGGGGGLLVPLRCR